MWIQDFIVVIKSFIYNSTVVWNVFARTKKPPMLAEPFLVLQATRTAILKRLTVCQWTGLPNEAAKIILNDCENAIPRPQSIVGNLKAGVDQICRNYSFVLCWFSSLRVEVSGWYTAHKIGLPQFFRIWYRAFSRDDTAAMLVSSFKTIEYFYCFLSPGIDWKRSILFADVKVCWDSCINITCTVNPRISAAPRPTKLISAALE